MRTGVDIDAIIEGFAILKNVVAMKGKAGRMSIHKDMENLFRDVLSLTYDLKVQNLRPSANFPAIDLGSEQDGVSYQVSSRNDNQKINETIKTFLRKGLDAKYPKLKFLLVSDKLKTYTVTTYPAFHFDPKLDILDLNDLISDIRDLPPGKIREIRVKLDEYLGYSRESESKGHATFDALIDIRKDMESCGLKTFSHWSADIRINGVIFRYPFFTAPSKIIFIRNPNVSIFRCLLTGSSRG